MTDDELRAVIEANPHLCAARTLLKDSRLMPQYRGHAAETIANELGVTVPAVAAAYGLTAHPPVQS